MKEHVVLVDEHDREIGLEEKLKAHQQGLLHRAFSIFIFNRSGSLLLQKRSPEKYHCASLWSNTCCSHPRPGETLHNATHRRLKEEMGIGCRLEHLGSFRYTIGFENGLFENEFDHVYYGLFDYEPIMNTSEVCDFKWIKLNDLWKDMAICHDKYTPWLKPALNVIIRPTNFQHYKPLLASETSL